MERPKSKRQETTARPDVIVLRIPALLPSIMLRFPAQTISEHISIEFLHIPAHFLHAEAQTTDLSPILHKPTVAPVSG